MSTKTSLMKLKVAYTFDSEQMFLSRSSANFKIKYGELDISDTETRLIGVVKLRSCIQTVLKSSPEMLSQLQTKYDYNVYVWDYSEYNSPLVSYGLLSNLLNTGYSPASDNSSTGKTKEIIIPGKVESSMSSLTSPENLKHSAYSLHIQLKFRQIDLDPNSSLVLSSISQISTTVDTNSEDKKDANDKQHDLMIKKIKRPNAVRSTNHNPAPRATRTYSMPATLLNNGITRSFSSYNNAHDTTITKGITYHMTDDALKINRKLSSGTVTTADDDEFLRLAAAKASKKQSKKKSENEMRKSKRSKIIINRKLQNTSNISNTSTSNSTKHLSENKKQSKNYWVIKNNISKPSASSPGNRSNKSLRNWNSSGNLSSKNTSLENLDLFENKENIPPFNGQQSAPYSMFAFPNNNNSSNMQFNIDSDLGSDATNVFQTSSSPQAIESTYTNNSISSSTSASSSPVQTSSPAISSYNNQNSSRFEISSNRSIGTSKTSPFSPHFQSVSMEGMPTSDTSISDDTSIVIAYSGKKEPRKNSSNLGIDSKIRKSQNDTAATIPSGISHTELEELLNFNGGSFLDSLYPVTGNEPVIHNEEASIITPEDHSMHTSANGNTYIGAEEKTPKDFSEALTPILEGTEDGNYNRQASINDKSNGARLNKQHFDEMAEITGMKDGFTKGSPKVNKDSALESSPFTVYD